jgi:hypothetical protein
MKIIPFMRFSRFKSQLPIIIFIVMSLNLLIAPVVYANTTISLDRVSTWAVGVRGYYFNVSNILINSHFSTRTVLMIQVLPIPLW